MPQWSWPDARKMREARGARDARLAVRPDRTTGRRRGMGRQDLLAARARSRTLIDRLREWLKENRKAIAAALLALIVLALLAASPGCCAKCGR